MNRRLRCQEGFTLIELLLVCVLFLVLMGATLTAFSSFQRHQRTAERTNDQVETARLAIAHSARQLRNLAKRPDVNSPNIGRAESYDFIFQTSDPAKKWVRYCLDGAAFGGSAGGQRLWESESSGTSVPAGATGACPGSGWLSQTVVASTIVNRWSGVDRPVFTYMCGAGAPAGCPSGGAPDFPRITAVGIDLFVDLDATRRPQEQRVSTSVFLRNQNEAPVAGFSSSPSPPTPRRVLLNGSASSDPEGRTLEYLWYRAPIPAGEARCTDPHPNAIGTGVAMSYTFPATDPASVEIALMVCDPGPLSATVSKSVSVPQ
jgi:prepilin-type N-terminal cleavage/methylation domain-containing protein